MCTLDNLLRYSDRFFLSVFVYLQPCILLPESILTVLVAVRSHQPFTSYWIATKDKLLQSNTLCKDFTRMDDFILARSKNKSKLNNWNKSSSQPSYIVHAIYLNSYTSMQ